MRILSVLRKLSVLERCPSERLVRMERCPYGEVSVWRGVRIGEVSAPRGSTVVECDKFETFLKFLPSGDPTIHCIFMKIGKESTVTDHNNNNK